MGKIIIRDWSRSQRNMIQMGCSCGCNRDTSKFIKILPRPTSGNPRKLFSLIGSLKSGCFHYFFSNTICGYHHVFSPDHSSYGSLWFVVGCNGTGGLQYTRKTRDRLPAQGKRGFAKYWEFYNVFPGLGQLISLQKFSLWVVAQLRTWTILFEFHYNLLNTEINLPSVISFNAVPSGETTV